MDRQYMKRRSMSLVIREIQIKIRIAVKYIHTLEWLKLRRLVEPNIVRIMDQVEFLDLGGAVKWDHYFGKSFGKFSVFVFFK